MEGIFSRFPDSMRPHPSFMNQKENVVPKRDGNSVKEMGFSGNADMEGIKNMVLEFDAEFRPIEHPLEPLDEDQPVKCPIPDSSFLNDEKIWKEPFAENTRKRAEMLVESEGSTAEQPHMRAVRKRHHTIDRDHGRPQSIKSHQNNIFHIFQPCKDFNS